jgi:transcription antitermination factor NusG
MTSFKIGWYLLYTRPKYEKKVASQLAAKQANFYLPMFNTVKNYCDRVKKVSMPLFPSYVFIHLEKAQDYFTGLNTDGVLHYVRFGNEVARVADPVIEDLKLLAEHGGELEVSFSEFQKGQTLAISEGPLAGLTCEMIQYKRKKHILVRVNLLNRNILLEMNTQQVLVSQ